MFIFLLTNGGTTQKFIRCIALIYFQLANKIGEQTIFNCLKASLCDFPSKHVSIYNVNAVNGGANNKRSITIFDITALVLAPGTYSSR